MSSRNALLLLVATLGLLLSPLRTPPASAANFIYAFGDHVFNDADWTHAVLLDPTHTLGYTAGQRADAGWSALPCMQVTQSTTLGYPGTFATVGHVSTVATFAPATTGRIVSISFSVMAACVWSVTEDPGVTLLLRQDGKYYVHLPFAYAYKGAWWQQLSGGPWTQADFVEYPALSGHPDFSAAGAPISFGFITAVGDGTPASCSLWIDDWSVQVSSDFDWSTPTRQQSLGQLKARYR